MQVGTVIVLVLAVQVGVFLVMDAMRHPTPLLRIGFALFLCIRFANSVIYRALFKYPAEQWPLLEPGPLRDAFMGAGSSTKQSTIASIDWTITSVPACYKRRVGSPQLVAPACWGWGGAGTVGSGRRSAL